MFEFEIEIILTVFLGNTKKVQCCASSDMQNTLPSLGSTSHSTNNRVKLCDPLTTRAIPERFCCGLAQKRHFINIPLHFTQKHKQRNKAINNLIPW